METARTRPIVLTLAIVGGPLVAVLASWLLSIGGSGPNGPLSLANTTLIMVFITLVAAVVDWRAGIATSIVASIALNYFHTAPYRTLRITDRQDLLSVFLLAAVGLTVSAAAAARTRTTIRRVSSRELSASGSRVSDLLAAGDVSAHVWDTASDGIRAGLATTTVRLTDRSGDELPTISRKLGKVGGEDRVTIPRAGGLIPLDSAVRPRSWLLVSPIDRDTVTEVERRSLVLLADAVEHVLAADGRV